jgi:hypothetical protein
MVLATQLSEAYQQLTEKGTAVQGLGHHQLQNVQMET